MNIIAIDVGGSHVKIMLNTQPEERKMDSGPTLSAQEMVNGVKKMAADWRFDAVSIGFPGPVLHGKIVQEPVNLGKGWVGFDFVTAFGCLVKVINDAAMQALGSYDGGRMLFLGLGTGLGSALIVDGILEPLELAHLPYKKHTFEDYVGEAGRKRLGRHKWRQAVDDVVAHLKAALEPDYIVLGGGNARHIETLPPDTRRGANGNAFLGGFRLWEPPGTKKVEYTPSLQALASSEPIPSARRKEQ